MQLVVIGLNQSSAPLEARERAAIVPERIGAALAELGGSVNEAMILSTCNRTEVYAIAGHAGSGSQLLERFLHVHAGLAPGELAPYLYRHSDSAAARHLFRVTAGLDSMVLGEDQIVAQVKAALAAAEACDAVGPRLHRLVAAALAASKRVRTETGVARSATSVVSVALDAARAELGSLDGRAVAVVGAGRTAEAVVRHCRSGWPDAAVTVLNRSAPRAALLAERFGARAAPLDALVEVAAEADLLVSATSAPCIVVGVGDLSAPRNRRLVCLDLSVPRDIDPAAAALPHLSIHDIDGLRRLASQNRLRREQEIEHADAIIDECVLGFEDWWRLREVAPAIARLRDRAGSIQESEVARALARLPNLGPAEQAVIRDLAARLTGKLLHPPMTNLKHAPDAANLAAALDRLFTPAPR